MFEGHPSWRSILGFYIKGLLGAVALGAIAYFASGAGLTAAVAGGLFALVILAGLIKRIATTYSISNQRLNIRRGIIARHVQETRLDRVQNVNTNQGVLERILQFGTVDFDTAGSGDSDFAFVGVAQPEKVMAAVEAAQREAAASGGLAGTPPGDPATPSPPALS
jgi:uncharacterized membrane protein YdbT with pleckstrin-like domain